MRNKESRRRVMRALWMLAILVVIVGTMLPAGSAPMRALGWFGVNDKVEHLLAYLTLALLPALHERSKFLVGAAVGAVALGITLEYGQPLTGRDFDIRDMAADAAGVCAGVALGLLLRIETGVGSYFGVTSNRGG